MAKFNDEGFTKCNELAKVGEDAYENLLKKYLEEGKIYAYVDLRDSRIARLVDLDYAVFTKSGGYESPTVKDVEELILDYSRTNHRDFCSFIDVKTDKVILKSGNIFLEMMMHGGPGCFANTRADNWIYCAYDVNDEKVTKAWSVDIRKMRRMIAEGSMRPLEYHSREKYVFSYNIAMKQLVELGLAKEINIQIPE